MVPHGKLLEFGEHVCETTEWHEGVRDEAQGAQLAGGDRVQRLEGIGAEVHGVAFLAQLRVAREVSQVWWDVVGVERWLEGDVMYAGTAVFGLDAVAAEEDDEAVGVLEGEGSEADVERLLAEEAGGECDGPACGTTVCARECDNLLPDFGRDTFKPALSWVHRLGIGEVGEH